MCRAIISYHNDLCSLHFDLTISSCNHSSKIVPSIRAFFQGRYLQGRLRPCLKHLGPADFPIRNIRIFSPRVLDAAIPAKCACYVFHLSTTYLRSEKILMAVLSQGVVISLVTFSNSPETSLKVMSYLQKR